MGSAQRRANVFPIESAHLDEVRVECSSEERERRAKAAQAESVVKRMEAENDLRSELGKAALKRVKWQLAHATPSSSRTPPVSCGCSAKSLPR